MLCMNNSVSKWAPKRRNEVGPNPGSDFRIAPCRQAKSPLGESFPDGNRPVGKGFPTALK